MHFTNAKHWYILSSWCTGNTCRYRCIWTSYQIRKIARCACAGNAGNLFPTTDFKGNRQLVIPACITARASRTFRDACRDRQLVVTGKCSRYSRRMRKPQFCVSGKRPMHFNGCLSCALSAASPQKKAYNKRIIAHYNMVCSALFLQRALYTVHCTNIMHYRKPSFVITPAVFS